MNYYDSVDELLLDLRGDLEEIGNENIWVYYDGNGKVTDYRYKNDPAERKPKERENQVIKEMPAIELLNSLSI
ncbi:hypothetical protein JZO70_14250 [Enterococcus sp. 669A]|uniref:Uncharacterized protein n=1 Tax=Candidatus Enterococcus moelleringii TaxID=2815325 RepID=A0ABS3LF22_9ENTE|nr:hypothetical protein [Enterococcus sp. 669A]MBO1307336.1 hypothetical protein [Enterococcus sp. 669A]